MLSVRTSLETRFDLLGLLTESTAGTTYVARERTSGETVALQYVGWRYSTLRQRERFVFEARTIARQSHPNLLAIREVLEGDDGLLIVYEYAAGQVLSSLLANGALPATQAAAYIVQAADVFEMAHRQGVIHGGVDLSCLLVTEAGLVKVFGFGSAALRTIEDEWQFHATDATSPEHKALERMRLRRVGYRAPECFTGMPADSRSDVFSLGCVFYEMLSGTRAFSRKNSELTAKAVVDGPPRPIHEVVDSVPSEIARVLRRCLRKDPDRRYQHMLDLKLDLQEQREEIEFAEILSTVEIPGARKRWWILPILAVLALTVYFGGHRVLYRAISPRELPAPTILPITNGDTLSADPFVSSDGHLLVYASDRDGDNLDVFLQSLVDGSVRRVTDDPADEREPTLSPDGRTIAYRSDRLAGGIYLVPTDGSAPSRWIANQGRRPRFSPDGSQIAFWARTLSAGDVGAIFVIPASGGPPRRLAGEFHTALYPVWSDDGRYLLFLGARTKGAWLEYWVAPVDGGPVENIDSYRIIRRWFISAMVPDAWTKDTLVFTGRIGEHTSLWKLRVPLSTLRAEGDSLRISRAEEDYGHASITGDGRVFFAATRDNINLWELPISVEEGRVTGAALRFYASKGVTVRPSLSHDGNWLAFTSDRGGNFNVWLRDRKAGVEERITDNPHPFFTPTALITPDGEWLAYTQYQKGKTVTHLRPARGGPATVLCGDCETPRDWSSDGQTLLYAISSHNYSIGTVERGTGVRTQLARSERVPLLSPRFGPNDRWIAFHALESPDVRKIFALAIKGTSSAAERQWVPITSGRILDRGAQWSPGGNLIYFMSERDGRRNIYAQRLDPQSKQATGQPFLVFESKATRRSLLNVPRGLAEMVVLPDRLVFTMGELSGNIMEARPAEPLAGRED